jgi:hypothetical protein
VRALSRDPGKHRELADEVVKADLNRPETLKAAFEGAHGVFLVTNFWEEGTDELKQATAAVRAAKDAGVKHFVWSTLPNVEAISGGKFHVPHFTGKAKMDRTTQEAGFVNHTFVIAPIGEFMRGNSVATISKEEVQSFYEEFLRALKSGDITSLERIYAGCVVLVRTIIVDHLQGVPERSGRWGEIFITVVDKDGAHRSPVAR